MSSSNMTTTWILTGLATTTAISVLVRNMFFQKQLQDKDDYCRRYQYIELNKTENQFIFIGMSPICTVTWFATGQDKDAYREIAKIIQDRMERIVETNPWLRGRFVKREKGKYWIEYPNEDHADGNHHKLTQQGSELELFSVVRTPPEGFQPATKDPAQTCAPFLLKPSRDTRQPLFKVCIVPSHANSTGNSGTKNHQTPNSFAMTVSMSHAAGDGHTYYSLYNMLVGATEVRSLNPKREKDPEEQAKNLIGAAEQNFIASTLGFGICVLRGFARQAISKLFSNNECLQPRVVYHLVDESKMKQLKDAAAKDDPRVSFCSSNDVISSWYFQNCRREIGLMPINLRNRAPCHADDDAGNYQSAIYYDTKLDTATPGLIRQSLAGPMKRIVTRDRLPSPLSFGLFKTAGFCTNWATFHANEVNFSTNTECNPLLHLPLTDWNASIPPSISVCVVFRPRPYQLAVCVAGAPNKLQDLLEPPFQASNKRTKELFGGMRMD